MFNISVRSLAGRCINVSRTQRLIQCRHYARGFRRTPVNVLTVADAEQVQKGKGRKVQEERIAMNSLNPGVRVGPFPPQLETVNLEIDKHRKQKTKHSDPTKEKYMLPENIRYEKLVEGDKKLG